MNAVTTILPDNPENGIDDSINSIHPDKQEGLTSEERLKHIAVHEAGHFLIAREFAAPVLKFEFALTDKGRTGFGIDMSSLTLAQKSIVYCAGMAGEVVRYGGENVNWQGLGKDSLRLNELGVNSQAEMAKYVHGAMKILKRRNSEFEMVSKSIEELLLEAQRTQSEINDIIGEDSVKNTLLAESYTNYE